jgi:hypothetical protein
MKDILAENMRRFNTKNLCEQDQVLPTINTNVVYRTQHDHFGVHRDAKKGDATAFIGLPRGTEFKLDKSRPAKAMRIIGTCYMVHSWTSGAPDSIKKMNPTDILNPAKQGLFAPYFNFVKQVTFKWDWSYDANELIIETNTAMHAYYIGTNLTTALINAFKVK